MSSQAALADPADPLRDTARRWWLEAIRATRLWDRQGQRHRHTNTHNYSTTTPSLGSSVFWCEHPGICGPSYRARAVFPGIRTYPRKIPSLCHWDRQRQHHRHGPDGRVLVAGTRRSSGAIEKSPYLRAALDTRIPVRREACQRCFGPRGRRGALRTARLRLSDRLAWFVGHDGLRSGFWQGRTCAAPSLPAALAHRHNHFNLIILRALDNLPTRRGLASF